MHNVTIRYYILVIVMMDSKQGALCANIMLRFIHGKNTGIEST